MDGWGWGWLASPVPAVTRMLEPESGSAQPKGTVLPVRVGVGS